MSELKENLKYVNRFAKNDELYDLNYVETVLNTDDESEIFTALKYAHIRPLCKCLQYHQE